MPDYPYFIVVTGTQHMLKRLLHGMQQNPLSMGFRRAQW
jgi:hypothetical protein